MTMTILPWRSRHVRCWVEAWWWLCSVQGPWCGMWRGNTCHQAAGRPARVTSFSTGPDGTACMPPSAAPHALHAHRADRGARSPCPLPSEDVSKHEQDGGKHKASRGAVAGGAGYQVVRRWMGGTPGGVYGGPVARGQHTWPGANTPGPGPTHLTRGQHTWSTALRGWGRMVHPSIGIGGGWLEGCYVLKEHDPQWGHTIILLTRNLPPLRCTHLM